MLFSFKKILFTITFNSSLFLLLIIGIQNSENSRKANLLISETVKLPTSFIIGVSFITGSIVGSLLETELNSKKKLI